MSITLIRIGHQMAIHGRSLSYLGSAFRVKTISPNLTTARRLHIPHITVPDISYSRQAQHVGEVAALLHKGGVLKVGIEFEDKASQYLQQLIMSLHERHDHQLPITHSASTGWFWDVRPSSTTFQSGHYQARSETMETFPWHTDCSYESLPPRYFALQVMQPDRFGGGTLSLLPVERLVEQLAPATLEQLMRPDYRIAIPAEFIKDPARRHIETRLLVRGEVERKGPAALAVRFRADIVTPLHRAAADAMACLEDRLRQLSLPTSDASIHLSAADLPARSIIMINNRRWLHARNRVADPERHLRRIRWDAAPFQ